MSATGRGPRLGGEHDYFQTPAWTVDRLLEAWDPPGGLWVEPGAGNGAIIRTVNGRRTDVHWLAVEVRDEERPTLEDCASEVIVDDFLTFDLEGRRDEPAAVVGNPPYALAQEFIERALDLYPGAWHAYLLRLPFAASAERAPFMRRHPPSVYVLPDRPSFRSNGSDNTDYAWFLWRPFARDTYGKFLVLATTPQSERDRKLMPAGRVFEPVQVPLFSLLVEPAAGKAVG